MRENLGGGGGGGRENIMYFENKETFQTFIVLLKYHTHTWVMQPCNKEHSNSCFLYSFINSHLFDSAIHKYWIILDVILTFNKFLNTHLFLESNYQIEHNIGIVVSSDYCLFTHLLCV